MSVFPTFARAFPACERALRAVFRWIVGADRRGHMRRLGAIAVLIALLAAAHVTCSLIARAELRSVDEAIRGWGLPTEVAQVIPPVLVESENAAPLLDHAFIVMSRTDTPYVPQRSSGGLLPDVLLAERWLGTRRASHTEKAVPLKPGEDESALAYLRSPGCAAICGMLHEAAMRPHLRFDLDYAAGPDLRLPHLTMMRAAANLLLARAEATGAGRTAAISDALTLGALLREEPFLVSLYVSISIDALALRELRVALADEAVGADDAATLADACSRPDDETSRFARALDSERLMFAEVFTGEAPIDESPNGRMYTSLLAFPLRAHDLACYERILGEASARLGRDGYAADLRLPSPGRLAVLSRVLIPGFAQTPISAARHRAQFDLACLALALRRHRADFGAYPKALDELAPRYLRSVPLQPWRGTPYAYELAADGGCAVSLPQDFSEHGRTVADRTWRLPP